MLRSVSFGVVSKGVGVPYELYHTVWVELNALKRYVYKLNGTSGDDVLWDILHHCLLHYRLGKGNLRAYIKKLAREMGKTRRYMLDIDDYEVASEDGEDFIFEIDKKISVEDGMLDSAFRLILGDPVGYLSLMGCLTGVCSVGEYKFGTGFRDACKRYVSEFSGFLSLLRMIDNKFGGMIRAFVNKPVGEKGWVEADYGFISRRTSSVLRLCSDGDLDYAGKLWVEGSLGSRRVYRVRYYELWSLLCDMVDAYSSSVCKLLLGDNCIYRTLGGSVSVVNSDSYGMYDLMRMEIVTNILKIFGGRYLGVGGEYVYLLGASDVVCYVNNIAGVDISFTLEDITDSLVGRS